MTIAQIQSSTCVGVGAVPDLYRCPKDSRQWTLKLTSLHKAGVTEKVGEGFNKRQSVLGAP